MITILSCTTAFFASAFLCTLVYLLLYVRDANVSIRMFDKFHKVNVEGMNRYIARTEKEIARLKEKCGEA